MYKNKVVVGILFVIITFFIARQTIDFAVLGTISSCCLYPLLRMQQAIVEPISHWFERSATIADLENKIEQLQKKHDDLWAENSALKSTHQYADETKELRNFNKRYADRGCIAQVLARHFSSNNQFFLVNAGSVHGVKKDMVALHCNAIVGKVTELYPWYCKICLITDADCKVASLTIPYSSSHKSLDKTKGLRKSAGGIHEGLNDALRTNMRYVSHLDTVHVGDELFSSGEGLVFPKGFLLGTVIAADKGDLFYTITVQPALDFQTLRYCTLIAKEEI